MPFVTYLSMTWSIAKFETSFAMDATEGAPAAEAVVTEHAPTENTVTSESIPAMILVLIFFVPFIFLPPLFV